MNLTERLRRLNVADIAMVKLSAMFFGMTLALYLADYLKGYELWLFALFILFAIKPAYAACGK